MSVDLRLYLLIDVGMKLLARGPCLAVSAARLAMIAGAAGVASNAFCPSTPSGFLALFATVVIPFPKFLPPERTALPVTLTVFWPARIAPIAIFPLVLAVTVPTTFTAPPATLPTPLATPPAAFPTPLATPPAALPTPFTAPPAAFPMLFAALTGLRLKAEADGAVAMIDPARNPEIAASRNAFNKMAMTIPYSSASKQQIAAVQPAATSRQMTTGQQIFL
ncbi:hypothetical protein [Nitrobacter sp. 62-23]|nr:hypothetical protein [Nitrobacter sp. 62-23]